MVSARKAIPLADVLPKLIDPAQKEFSLRASIQWFVIDLHVNRTGVPEHGASWLVGVIWS